MLEGTVARILNQLLGKYVQDLDTENLNVGIFSGKVQLTDLKLKPEALYELKLPIEVIAGTIGKIWIQIPWTALWNHSIIVNVEDVHIIVKPIVRDEVYDPEKNKRLLRAYKKRILEILEYDGGVLGGPSAFAEHLVSNILNYIQLNISNIHVRYEDEFSYSSPVAVGLCVGSITAQTTNSKWKKSTYESQSDTSYYLIKTDAISIYWNTGQKSRSWNLPSEYYTWRNTMLNSLQNYSYEGKPFKFILNPMMSKIKMIITKSNCGHVSDINTEIIVQDCNLQISKVQYDSMIAVVDNFERMSTSWQFIANRPQEKVLDNLKAWWRYAYFATVEQRVKPLTWSKIKTIRGQYKKYIETYKQIIANPNDTELKLDLQKHEDNLSIINVVIARQHTRLLMQSKSQSEKSFWSLLPSPEKIVLCEKIGYSSEVEEKSRQIDHTYNFKLGNFNLVVMNNSKEILVTTITQTIVSLKPNFLDSTYKFSLKIEGIIIEGNGPGEALIPLATSEHLKDSPAFFFAVNLEKMKKENNNITHRLQVSMSSVECIYNKKCFEDIEVFLQASKTTQRTNLLKYLKQAPDLFYQVITKKISDKWDLNLNIKFPYFVIPETSAPSGSEENLLVIDLGKYIFKTEICAQTHIIESATKMELEEQLYSKLYIDCTSLQILFCDKHDHWKDARNEKDTEMHVIPKTNFNAVLALAALDLNTIPRLKFNILFNSFKLNISERKIGLILRFFNVDQIRINVITDAMQPDIYIKDRIYEVCNTKTLKKVQEKVGISDTFKYRKQKLLNGQEHKFVKDKSIDLNDVKNNMNEAWARTVDLPGLEDNISPKNNIEFLYGMVVKEFSMVFSKSSDSTDRQYLTLRLGHFTMDVAFMTYGPAYQISIHSILLTDKLHTTPSGQYLDLIFTPLPNNLDVITILYRKVSANCPDFWSHFHGVETSLVANFETIHLLLHQEAFHTIIKYSKYLSNKIQHQTSQYLKHLLQSFFYKVNKVLHKQSEVPVPPGSVKFSHSARMSDLNVTVCDSDFDIVNVYLSGLEIDFLFRANERFVFRSYLGSINVDHMSQLTLYSKVLYTDEDKVFEVKYVRNASHIRNNEMIGKSYGETYDGNFKFELGRIHCIFLYKLMVQLQRFIIDLEALDFVERYARLVRGAIKTATDTLKNKTKISLAINVCGPVLLIPQKSSSPNVMIIDTGKLSIENFFKESENEVTENIMVKLKEVIVTRGVIGLTSILEMQETLIEPTCLKMDIKKLTNLKSQQKTWEIDSIMDKIEVTLGQKDLAMIMAIYTDNIGEAKIVDLLPEQIKSPIAEIFEQDDDVRELEAFFCEPKQKFLVGKCKIDEVKIVLFFDSNELLSSPIRDLNHGLCKLEVNDIDTSVVIYTDKSSDGKLSIDKILIEEIGPDANIHSKIVLSSPAEDGRNNNICNITVNKPPIVDVTFHQNKNRDLSADVIVGRMCLSLSIPFCEKVALYVLECIPKDSQDLGIVNQGYEAETKIDQRKNSNSSLTVSVRVNKPELMFLVETTSNKKRYFITKSEILIDFSRHCNRLNLVTSLSGLYSLFYDLSEYSDQPYVVLKQCDIELSRNIEDNNEKITLNISGVYIKLCSEVIHSVNDILNDIVEHFKIPELEIEKKIHRRLSKKESETEDLWEPKKIEPYVNKQEPIIPSQPTHLYNQCFSIPKFEIVVIFELEQIQVILLKSSVEFSFYDWNYMLTCTGDVSIQSNYFNENVQKWEPLIDPVVVEENEYRPWECHFKIFQDKSMPINDIPTKKTAIKKSCSSISKTQKTSRSYTTTESEDSGEDMMYLEPVNTVNFSSSRRVKTSLSTFLDDSDSENEEGAMEKLAAAISDLFTGDWNEHDDSECDHSSEDENDVSESAKPKEPVPEESFSRCLYVLVNAKDPLNITLTPAFLKIFNELVLQYSTKIISVKLDRKSINVSNDIGPHTKVELYEKQSDGEKKDILISLKKFENEDSPPTSPTKHLMYQESVAFEEERLEIELKHDYEQGYDFNTIRSLKFPPEVTSDLFDKINKHYVKIFVPNFSPVQTNCSKKNWEKLVKLQSNSPSVLRNYYLAAKHTIGRSGREINISSPLQIQNETRFALNILYQPSVLQQINVEPVGEVTNPFETTMRIAILEAHEKYNVPLYIAYHCKLFIQPAYAEGHYASQTGIWWKDMATEIDAAYNLICHPKNDSNLEIFALRVVLKKNLNITNSQAHSVPNYVIRLLPPLTVHNFLPYALEVENITLKQAVKAEPGEKCSVYSLDLTKDQKLAVKVTYNSSIWTGHVTVTGHLDEKVVLLSSDQKDETKDLTINIKCDREGSCNLIFYAPYWIVNKTGLPLKIKASSSLTINDCPNDDILLFTYKRHCKQTLNVKVYESNWSNEFGVECSGTTGLVICKDNERKKKYLFFLNTSLSNFCPRLTKIVSILPSFLVINNTEKALRFMENNEKTDLWIDLEPSQTLIFWPETSSMQIYVKYRESKSISQAFFISCQHRTVLRMDKGTAITVDVTGGNSGPFHIAFNNYSPGDCPILIQNYCADLFLKIQQQDQSPVTLMSPFNSLLYTWDDPTKPRTLVWNVYNNKGSGFVLDINKDGYGEERIKFQSVTPNTSQQEESSSSEDSDSSSSTPNTLHKKIRKDKIIIYWACFINGPQRKLLFTQEQGMFENILKVHFHEHCYFELILSMSSIGLSVFTSENDKKEHAYACISDSPAIWEVNVGQKWKTLTLELASWIEDKYKRSHSWKKCHIKDYIHIDFEKMFMLKPFFAEMRRTYTPGLNCHFRKSTKFQYFDFRLNYLQMDNKHSNCIVFQPILTKPEEDKYQNRPFFKLVALKQSENESDSYRYVKMDVQDASLNVENDLWTKICELLKENKKFGRDYSCAGAYVIDITNVRKSICSRSQDSIGDTHQRQCHIENLSLSSFGIQLNISNRMQMGLISNNTMLNRTLDHLFPYNMAPYMPMEGVHHKITSTEWVHVYQPLSSALEQLIDQVACQFLQQYYSHVLGLQVLVNTFAIQSGIETIPLCNPTAALSVTYASQCLLGHATMSPAALETCVLDVFPNLNLDLAQLKCVIRKRNSDNRGDREEILPKIVANCGKTFAVGVPIALAQLFVKNHNVNIQCDGEMFFKTTGKALYSLITRHPDEKSDCIELAREALKRASLLGEPIKIHQRLTRYRNILGLTPFSTFESMGQHLLEKVGNSRFSNDTYWTHAATDRTGKSIVIISLQRVIRINKCTLWGPWEVEWMVDLDDIISLPKINCVELILNMRQSENFAGEQQIKILGPKEILVWLHEKIEQAIILSMEDKSFTLTDN
ncbi:vacuolar protein sorting-associated protein 13A-like [Sitophilus oryzae]|uniref:Vacuolar protein sorting-associated protein 13A-like n=1 Tax=Sitophilus oryzae TaxID=7048 RepID=A0A6J2XXR2_SITOR|nr:vacuolar protein sorting-associated protein 13A-like [Sitophilus oryzae]